MAAIPSGEAGLLTNFAQVTALSSATDKRDYPFRLQMVVTYNDPGWNIFYGQDASGPLYLPPFPGQSAAKAGDQVEVEGVASSNNGILTVSARSLKVLGRGVLPKPRKVSRNEMLLGKLGNAWVETQGIVRRLRVQDRLIMVLMVEGERFNAVLLNQSLEDSKRLLNTRVRVRGVFSSNRDAQGRPAAANPLDLLVPSMDHVKILAPAPEDPEKSVPVSIASVIKSNLDNQEQARRVHFHGVVVRKFADSIIVQEAGSSLRVLTDPDSAFGIDDRVSVSGYLAVSAGERVVEDAMIGDISAPPAPAKSAPAKAGTDPETASNLPTLRSIGEILKLTSEAAQKGYPVHLNAVATFSDPEWTMLFLQDDSGAIYAANPSHFAINNRDAVEIQGFTIAGGFAPSIDKATFKVLGPGVMPKPRVSDIKDLETGEYDCRWVELEGVVRAWADNWGRVVLKLTSRNGQFEAMIPGLMNHPLATNYLGATLRLRGACGIKPNQFGQAKGVLLHVPGSNEVVVLEAPAADPFSLPTRQIRELLRYRSQESMGHPVKLRGTITLLRPARMICLQDKTGGLLAELRTNALLAVGQDVEIVGFAAPGEFSPKLQDAVVRVLGAGPPLPAAAVSADRVLTGATNNMELVQVEARLLEDVPATTTPQLLLQDGAMTFTASQEMVLVKPSLAPLRGGSRLRVTGVCSIQAGLWGQPRSFHILLRSPADVVVLKAPPRLTMHQALGLTGGLGAVTLLVSAWVVTLRRRVRRQTELMRQKLRQEAALEARYRELFENASDIMFTVDFTGRMLSLNKAAESVFGLAAVEAQPRAIFDLLAPDHHPGMREVMRRLREGEAAITREFDVVNHAGQRVILEVSSRLIREDGQAAGLECIGRNVTGRKQAEDRLRFLQFGVDHASDSLFWLASDGRFIYVNESACRLLESTREELLALHYFDIDPGVPAAQWPEHWSRLKRAKSTQQSSKFLTKGKRWMPVEVTSNYLEYHLQEFACLIARDITEHLHLEEQLRQAQKMEAVGQLAGGVAHDFNNILTIIQGHASLLLAAGTQSPDNADSLRQVTQAAERAAGLTRQLLTFSRRQALQKQPLDLNEVIAELVKMLQRLLGEDVILEFKHDPCLPAIEADRGMLEQVLMNLAVNARDAMPSGGRLRLATAAVEISALYAQNNPEARPGAFVRLRVLDTGCGMDSVTLQRIFEPFFTTKPVGKGTGLGLATVYGVVKQHSGWVEVESQVGQGTTFSVYFPACTNGISHPPGVEKPNGALQGGTETILLVEDELALRMLAREVLRRQGYRVFEAASGPEALKMWNNLKGSVDLLVTDMIMPQGMTGWELARTLTASDPFLRVLYTSGYSMDLQDQNLKLNPGHNFLAKPYAPASLTEIVRVCLDEPVPLACH